MKFLLGPLHKKRWGRKIAGNIWFREKKNNMFGSEQAKYIDICNGPYRQIY